MSQWRISVVMCVWGSKCFLYLDVHVPRCGRFSAVVLLKWFSVSRACGSSSSAMPWLEYFLFPGYPRALAFSLHGFLLLFCSSCWTLTIQKTCLRALLFFFSSAWSNLLLRLPTNFSCISLLRIVRLLGWVPFMVVSDSLLSGFLLMMCFGR